MPVNPNSILIWAQLGQQLVQIGSAEYDHFQAAMQAKGIVADTAQLEKLRGLYDARIARREADVAHTGTNDTGE